MLLRKAGLLPAVVVLSMLGGNDLEAAAALPAGVKQVVSVEGITEFKLDNGLRALLFPDSSKPQVTVNMTVLVGSRHEGYGEAGMAHLLEHMLFKGTPNFPTPKAIPSALNERGADPYNASTWLDRTNYYEVLPASDSNLEFAIRLESDRLVNSFVRNADLKSEMTVVRNEFERGENSPEYILLQRMFATAFEWHNYGKSTIGNRADIERVPIENLRDFYVRYYQPDNTLVVVAGKFDSAKALELIAKYFGRIPKPERELNTTYTEEPPQDGERTVHLRRVGDVPVVGVTYHVPAGGHKEFAAVEILEGILSDDPSGRLYKSLVHTKKAASVSGLTYSLHDPGMIVFMADVVNGQKPQDVLKAMLATLDDVAKNGVTKEETERIKRQILKRREMLASNSTRVALGISEWAAQGDWRLYFLHRDRIEMVTAEQVSQAAAKYLKPDNRTLGLFIPTKSPDRTSVPMIANLEKSIGDYKGRGDIARGEVFDSSPENIDARTKTVTLPSGIEASLLEKKTRGAMVHVDLKLRYGDVKNLQNLNMASDFLPELMMRGTKTLSYQQIQDKLDELRATIRTKGGPGSAVFTIQSRRDSLPAVLKLLGQILREPSLPESEFEILKRSQLAEMEKGLTEPQELAITAVQRHLAPYKEGDPRYVPTLNEEIALAKGLKLDDVKKLYTEYLNGMHGELVIIGDFDAAQTISALNAILGDWKSGVPYAHISRDVKSEIPGGFQQIAAPDKANATYLAALVIPMRDDDPDFAPLAIGDHILGGGVLASRLADRVRQKEGLSYSIRSSLNASAKDQRTAFSIFATSNPHKMQQVRTVIAEEIERLLSKGISAQELAAAKEGFLNQERNQRGNDGYLMRTLSENLTVGRSMKYYTQLEKRIRDLTADEVMAAMRKYIDPKRLFIVTAGDFGKGKTPEPAGSR